MQEVEIEIDESVFLPKYRHLHKSNADIIVLWGGRDSGKSHDVAQELIVECLSQPYFKCILSRKVQDTIKDSQWQTIKSIIEEWGLSDLFDFTTKPLEIRCTNGNRFIARGADKNGKIKGVANPTHAWFEEMNQITQDEYSVISTTLRATGAKIREYWTFNPECDGDYHNFWLYKIVGERYDTYRDVRQINVGDKKIDVIYEFVHSTYEDNPFCPDERKAKYLNTVEGDDYLYNVWIKGRWGDKLIKNPFARFYDESKHVAPTAHNPNAISYVLIDFNVNPFSCSIFNVWHDGTPHCHQVAEIEIKEGTTSAMANAIKIELGSALGLAKFGGDFKGFDKKIGKNNNNSLFKELAIELGISFESQFKKAPNPYHNVSANDCNYFLKHFPDFKIGEHCTSSRRDLRTVQVNEYGNIIKADRTQENQRADFLDNFRYLVNTFFKDAINRHKKNSQW